MCLSFSGNFFEILSTPFAHSLSLFSPWKMALTVDDILERIGSLGLYQLRLIFILSYIEFAMTLQVRMWYEIVSCMWYRIFLSFKSFFNLLFERNASKNPHLRWPEPIYIRVGHVFESRVFRQGRFNRFLRFLASLIKNDWSLRKCHYFLVNKRQYCFSRPLKLEVHVRDWTTGYRPLLNTSFLQKKTPKSRDRFFPKFSKIASELYSFISASLVVIVTVELTPQNVGQI